MSIFEEIRKEASIPLPAASAFMVQLHRKTYIPNVPEKDKLAQEGFMRMAIIKHANPQLGYDLIADRAAIDPGLQAALTIQELAAEREHMLDQLQQKDMMLQQTSQQTAQMQQQIQQISAQAQQAQQAAAQASQQAAAEAAARQQVQSEVIAVKDQNLQEQLITQQQREQMSAMADNLKAQLDQVKQVVSMSPAQIAQQQQAEAQAQQQQVAPVDPSAPAEVQKQQLEAYKATTEAGIQQQQVQDTSDMEAMKQEQQMAQAQQTQQGQKVAALRRVLRKYAAVSEYKSPKEQPASASEKIRSALKRVVEEKEMLGSIPIDDFLAKTGGSLIGIWQ